MARIKLLGVNVDLLQPAQVLDTVISWLNELNRFRYISSTNLNNISHACDSSRFLAATNTADLSIMDGMPLLWYGRYRGYELLEKCGAEELMYAVFELSKTGTPHRHFFYGNTPEVLERVRVELLSRYPRLDIVGMRSPPFRPLSDEEHAAELAIINAAKPHFLWVSLGCPKQELWLYANRHRLSPMVGVGIGAVLNFIAGMEPTAPTWVKYAGLEWALRLCCSPKRLYKRYLLRYPSLVAEFVRRREWRTP